MPSPSGYQFADLAVGMSAQRSKTIEIADIEAFARLSGDDNPVHLDEDYARKTMFKGRISHGMLPASLISAVLGTALPGPGVIYLSQQCRFKAPVRPGDTVTARVEVTELFPDKKRVALKTVCSVGDRVVIDGEALVMMP